MQNVEQLLKLLTSTKRIIDDSDYTFKLENGAKVLEVSVLTEEEIDLVKSKILSSLQVK